ncbi:MAG: hypothetical protein K0R82_1754 [Flavipsychrobacter sp.]|jgi:hypothetical protein|nr:hypothetical protein [Flavipsychrobacter sp.]
MPELLLSIYFSYKNALIAKAKGLNTIIWVFLTLLAFLAGEFIAIAMVIGLFYRGPFNQTAVLEYLFTHPIHVIFIYFTAIGGCLLIRYILEKSQSTLPPKVEETEEESEQENYN